MDVEHYFISAKDVEAEIERVRVGRDVVIEELQRLQTSITHMGPKEAPHELSALLDVHLMLLQDAELISGVKSWISDRLYNAEWALTTQLEVIARHFDEMEDAYLRERKADLEQIVERILRAMKGVTSPVIATTGRSTRKPMQQDLLLGDTVDVPLVLVAHDLSPADMLQFKCFCGVHHRCGWKNITHGHCCPQHGHPCRRGCENLQPVGTPRRLDHHRWGCRRHHR